MTLTRRVNSPPTLKAVAAPFCAVSTKPIAEEKNMSERVVRSVAFLRPEHSTAFAFFEIEPFVKRFWDCWHPLTFVVLNLRIHGFVSTKPIDVQAFRVTVKSPELSNPSDSGVAASPVTKGCNLGQHALGFLAQRHGLVGGHVAEAHVDSAAADAEAGDAFGIAFQCAICPHQIDCHLRGGIFEDARDGVLVVIDPRVVIQAAYGSGEVGVAHFDPWPFERLHLAFAETVEAAI